MGRCFRAQDERVGRPGGGDVFHETVGGGAKTDAAGPVRGEAHDDHLVGETAEDLASERGRAHAIADDGDRAIEIDGAHIAFGRRGRTGRGRG